MGRIYKRNANSKWYIDLKRNEIKVRNSKNNESRIIPMNKTLTTLFNELEHRNEDVYIFARKDGRRIKSIRTGFKAALKRAGIKNLKLHDLSHTFASYLAMGGASIRTIQELMGHKDIKMTLRYSHLSQAHLKNAVDSLDNTLNKNGTNLAHTQKLLKAKFG